MYENPEPPVNTGMDLYGSVRRPRTGHWRIFMYINFICPPLPHLIAGGISLFRKGNRHERRAIHKTFDLIYVEKGTLYMEENGIQFDVKRGIS